MLLEKIPEVWLVIPELDRKDISREFPKLAEQFDSLASRHAEMTAPD